MSIRQLIPWARDGRTVPVVRSNPHAQVSRDPFADFFAETDRLFEQAFAPHPSAAWPRVDLVDTGETLQLTAELPGVDEGNVDVALDGARLTLKGEKRAESRGEKDGWYRAERSYGAFERTLELPCEIDEAKVAARLANGVLTVTLPKAARALPRKIDVRRA